MIAGGQNPAFGNLLFKKENIINDQIHYVLMKKVFLLSLLCLMTMMVARAQQVRTFSLHSSANAPAITAHDLDKAELVSRVETPAPAKAKAKVAGKAYTADDFTGEFIAKYWSLNSNCYDGGGTTNLTKEADDTIVYNNFIREGFNLKIKISSQHGRAIIPVQQVGTYEGHPVYFKVLKKDNSQDVVIDEDVDELVGYITSRDTVFLGGWWILVMPDVNQYLYMGYQFYLFRPNATVVCTPMGSSEPMTRKIVAHQVGDELELTNLGGYGQTIYMQVRNDNSVRCDETNLVRGTYYQGGAVKLPEIGLFTPVDYVLTDSTINVFYALFRIWGNVESPRKVTWDKWFIGPSNIEVGQIYQIYNDATIELPFDLAVPEAPKVNLSGTGTEADPYLINNTDDWDTVATASLNGIYFTNKYIKVNADLDFTGKKFTPIASASDYPFSGILDGAGHTITMNWNAPAAPYQGLLSYVEQKGVIKNLTVAGEITFNEDYCGTFAGNMLGGSKVENCVNKATLHIPGRYKGIGGIGGYSDAGFTIEGCTNEGTISYEPTTGNYGYLGGIMGYAVNGSLINCTNNGKFAVADTASTWYIGGIVGYMLCGSVQGCVNAADITCHIGANGIIGHTENHAGLRISGCINKGNITVTDARKDSQEPTGGIVGTLTDYTTIEDCVNMGTINGNNNTGGIFGWNYGTEPALVKNCVNAGTVTGNKESVGGIGGFTYVNVALDSCYNLGDVIAPDASRVAGIVGQLQGNSSEIENCVNSGHVSGKFWVGGILGNQAGNYAATGCYNTGLVDGNSRAGGINGYSAYYSKVSESFNVGEIKSRQDSAINNYLGSWAIGGLGGWVSSHYDNCYNAGLINGRVNSAGILANVYRSAKQDIIDYTASVTNSYNCGLVAGDVDSCGHIIGVHVANNNNVWRTKDWTYLDTIDNVFYLDGISPNCIIEKENPQKGLTSAELCKLLPTDKFTSIGDYCYPVLKRFENNPWAKLYAAAIVPKEGNDLVNITGDFHIGAPADVKWTSSYAGLTITGNAAKFGKEPYNGEITLTGVAPAEELPMLANTGVVLPTPTRTIVLKVNYKGSNGISDVNATKAVKSVLYYNVAGQMSAEPFEGVNIVKTTYTDGTSRVAKVMK